MLRAHHGCAPTRRHGIIVGVGDFLWVFGGIIVFSVLLYLAAAFVFGPGEPQQPAGEPVAEPLVEGRPLRGADVRDAKFRVVARGYHMGDVDRLLSRVAAELDTPHPADPSDNSRDPSVNLADPSVNSADPSDVAQPGARAHDGERS